ncbi:MAG TPA: hypothetical protein DCS97_03380 [Planctomycetes bacterium]|nr:hypothetical protein [Planctomycetota bacterium]
MIGLAASALTRLAAGGVFCLLAIALVWWIEREVPVSIEVSTPKTITEVRRMRIAAESTYPVVRWQVLVLGQAQSASSSDQWSWHGTVEAPGGEEIVVIAQADPAAAQPHRGLRLRLGDLPERLVWGSGDLVVTGTIP